MSMAIIIMVMIFIHEIEPYQSYPVIHLPLNNMVKYRDTALSKSTVTYLQQPHRLLGKYPILRTHAPASESHTHHCVGSLRPLFAGCMNRGLIRVNTNTIDVCNAKILRGVSKYERGEMNV